MKSQADNEKIVLEITGHPHTEIVLLYWGAGKREDPFSYIATFNEANGVFLIEDPQKFSELNLALWELGVPRMDIPQPQGLWERIVHYFYPRIRKAT